ncbi:MAG: hypothetical protein V4539_14030 [Bacteroidota bacterium]
MTQSLLTTLLPIIISAGALTISGLIYVRRRTVENENHFFNFKLEQYIKIIESASTVHNPVKLTYLNRSKLTYPLAGEDLNFQWSNN